MGEWTVREQAAMSRRRFLAGSAIAAGALGAAAATAGGWIPAFRIPAASAASTIPPPPDFPAGIPLYQQAFVNWSEQIVVEGAWTCAPQSVDDVVTLANWAWPVGYEIRPRGMMHGWSPLAVPVGSSGAGFVLADTTQCLTAISIDISTTPATFTAQAGATMDAILEALEQAGLGLTANPAPGDVTLGGVLAVNGHGTSVPADEETRTTGHTYGSLSNLILSLDAVVWDPATSSYVLSTFERDDPAIQPLLAHLGRTFVTQATLQVGVNSRLRCQSFTDIPASVLFGAPGSNPSNLDQFLAQSGRVEAIWFPFTSAPWLKVWTVSPEIPTTSREVDAPYNYIFADVVPTVVSNLAALIIEGVTAVTPEFGEAQYEAAAVGLVATDTTDIWGWSKDLTLYVKPTTIRFATNGYAVITESANVQQVVNDFATFHSSLLAEYRAAGEFPVNGPVEIRVTGLDVVTDVDIPGALEPQLSALRPRPDQPGWDVAVWIDVLSLPQTPSSQAFYRQVEQWFFSNFAGSYAMVRPEWSKGWAYSGMAPWTDPGVIGTTIPDAYRAGQASGDNWDSALAALDAYDPYRIFTNAFLDELTP
jgi:FAD/FMN-containing dehydrogenase